MAQHLAQDHASVERDVFILVTGMRSKENLALPRDVFDRRPARTDLPPEKVVEDLHDVLPGLKVETRDVDDEQVQQVRAVRLLRKLREKLRYGLWVGNIVLDGSRGRGKIRQKWGGTRSLGKRTSIAIEHALDLLQVLADLFAGLSGEAIQISVASMTAIEWVRAHLFPRLTGRGRLEFEDVVSQATHQISRRPLLCLEKVHGVAIGGGKKEDRVRA